MLVTLPATVSTVSPGCWRDSAAQAVPILPSVLPVAIGQVEMIGWPHGIQM